MPEYISLEQVQGMAGGARGPEYVTLDDVREMEDARFREYILKRETTDLAYGVRRGLRDAWDTGAELLAGGFDKVAGAITGNDPREYERVKAMNDANRNEATAGRPVTPGSVLGYVGGNTLATTPILRGAQLALGATGVPGQQAFGNAINSGGMTTGRALPAGAGMLPRAVDMGTRMGGGAVAGYVGGGLADPELAGESAAIGAGLPPALQLAQAGMRGAGRVISTLRPAPGVSGADVRAARDIAGMAGAETPEQMAAIRDALRQQGPQIIPGQQTVPEILQAPGVSQLQRTVQAKGANAPFVQRGADRELARREVLERIAPVGNRTEVMQEVGTNITDYATAAHDAARARVSAKFNAVDPFGEARIPLPIDEMRAAKDQFLGPGSFGSGGMAEQSIRAAERIGTQTVPGIKPLRSAGRQPQDIVQAVRRLGGINPNSAGGMNREIAELGRKQTGTTGLVSKKGRTIDRVAELLHERNFLDAPDPDELISKIHANMSGHPVYGADVPDDAFRARYEASMGDVPTDAVQSLQPVSFDELQNLRSSIGEQWRIANRSGNLKEAAALDAQRRAIDSALDNLAAGNGGQGANFPPDMVEAYKAARKAHAEKQLRFKTGPQAGLFRQGGDGLPLAQGGEVPRRFFNANASQVADAEGFRRLVANDPQLMSELKRYAVSDAAGQVDQFGNLTSAKFNRWLDSRQGAIGVTFNEGERAALKAIAEDLRRAALAENLGRSTGSDTAQKVASLMRLGMLDSAPGQFLIRRIPSGGLLSDALSSAARTAKADRLGGLLLDPERTAGLLDVFIATQQSRPAGLLGQTVNPALTRSAPLLLGQPLGVSGQ